MRSGLSVSCRHGPCACALWLVAPKTCLVGSRGRFCTNHDGSRRMRFDILVRFIHISLGIEQTGRFVNIVSKEQCSECSESDSADHHLHVYSSTVRYILYLIPLRTPYN